MPHRALTAAACRFSKEQTFSYRRYTRNVSQTFSQALFAEGQGKYFVVLTLSENDRHPEVTVRGRGLDATVTVGDQTIRYDGTKIVFGR